jgi:hypothetical protein
MIRHTELRKLYNLVSVAALARTLNVSSRCVYYQIANGNFPAPTTKPVWSRRALYTADQAEALARTYKKWGNRSKNG